MHFQSRLFHAPYTLKRICTIVVLLKIYALIIINTYKVAQIVNIFFFTVYFTAFYSLFGRKLKFFQRLLIVYYLKHLES